MLVLLGVCLFIPGLLLAWRPSATARAANYLRSAPISDERSREYRVAGLFMALFGAVIALLGSLT